MEFTLRYSFAINRMFIFILVLCPSYVEATSIESKPEVCTHLNLRTNLLGEPHSCGLSNDYENTKFEKRVSLLPDCLQSPPMPTSYRKSLTKSDRKKFAKSRKQCQRQLKYWYADYLMKSNYGLQNAMVLFWHNHFTTSLKKVKEPQLIYKQHLLIEHFALGRFDIFLQEMLMDPAMLIYLDNTSNIKNKPNENLAREMLELFTMGEGNYSEKDIKELARALTGLTVNKETFETQVVRGKHDNNSKVLFNHSANYDVKSAVDQILKQPKTAEYITRKIWSHFVSKTDEAEISRLSLMFFDDWDIGKLVDNILATDQFYADKGKMIKSPLELIIGTARMVGNKMISSKDIVSYSMLMGQDIFNPPNVKGWPVGNEWVTADRMLTRVSFSERIMRGVNEKNSDLSHYVCKGGKLNFSAALPPISDLDASDCLGKLKQLLDDAVWQLK
ncbi:DUF1800 family protein [Amphritea sp. 2_MG-2023]|uniref:DUF1800 domain-containing protein n=1 Tax=Amphritea TaxID=515417 RepID=UPI001C06A8EF|nr:DUF1800 family protein [Amphritea sp. 2_MG-2023]MBU2964350.1 DUF1800 domain-containing protein [Amphritea atlantica]MDO6419690.1 DUF1800 family protein [Amphritea sp. 2_MG-2023]